MLFYIICLLLHQAARSLAEQARSSPGPNWRFRGEDLCSAWGGGCGKAEPFYPKFGENNVEKSLGASLLMHSYSLGGSEGWCTLLA